MVMAGAAYSGCAPGPAKLALNSTYIEREFWNGEHETTFEP
jgi:hypothetical protein